MGKQNEQKNSYEICESHIRGAKNHYKMMRVKLYRTVLDIMLFYLAFVYFRYGKLMVLPEIGLDGGIIGTTTLS